MAKYKWYDSPKQIKDAVVGLVQDALNSGEITVPTPTPAVPGSSADNRITTNSSQGTAYAASGASGTFYGTTASGAEAWAGWIAPSTGNLELDSIGSSYDTILHLRNAATGDVASDDDSGGGGTSQISSAAVTQGTQYYFRMLGFNNAGGNYQIHWSLT